MKQPNIYVLIIPRGRNPGSVSEVLRKFTSTNNIMYAAQIGNTGEKCVQT